MGGRSKYISYSLQLKLFVNYDENVLDVSGKPWTVVWDLDLVI